MRLLRIYEADIVSAYRLDRTGEGPRRAVYSYVYNHLGAGCCSGCASATSTSPSS